MALLEFSGRTTEEAINNASAALNVPPERLRFVILQAGSKGILGIGSRGARIRVDSEKSRAEECLSAFDPLGRLSEGAKRPDSTDGPDHGDRPDLTDRPDPADPPARPKGWEKAGALGEAGFGENARGLDSFPEPSPRDEIARGFSAGEKIVPALFGKWPREGFSPADFLNLSRLRFKSAPVVFPPPPSRPLAEEVVPDAGLAARGARAREILLEITGLMGFETEAELKLFPNLVVLNILGSAGPRLIGRRGVGLDALEIAVSAILEKSFPERGGSPKIVVDALDYRARRHLGVILKTLILADECLERWKPRSIPQLTSLERTLARTVAALIEGVGVRALGGGVLRNIQIYPAAKGGAPAPGVRRGGKRRDAAGKGGEPEGKGGPPDGKGDPPDGNRSDPE
ncbi:MAG: Jag N-terminal domain-containing protein [Deltaproteobacteria bacterium]|jgi:predicted RNA-binding protein Jag|nr:Jag N-terminal domain-containing protein [Deltaproteobacteria bacterium]